MDFLNKPFQITPKIDVPDLGKGILAVQRFGEFVREVRENSAIIKDARVLNALKSYEVDISRISLGVELEPGRNTSGTKVAPTADEVTVSTNTLEMKELVTKVVLEDEALEDNIEQSAFEQTITSLLASGVTYDLECFFLHADSSLTTGRELYRINDGWMKLAGNQYTDAEPEDENWPLNLFDGMMDELDTRYLQLKPKMKFYVSNEIYNGYRKQLLVRETGLGDSALMGATGLQYDGIPIQYVPALDALGDDKARALLTVPTNLVYGFWRNIRIEPRRDAEMRRTEYIASLRADCNYEDENAAVAAVIDMSSGG